MRIYWQDQAEYYYICDECYDKALQDGRGPWSGSTTVRDWNAHKKAVYEAMKEHHKCEWCGKEAGTQ